MCLCAGIVRHQPTLGARGRELRPMQHPNLQHPQGIAQFLAHAIVHAHELTWSVGIRSFLGCQLVVNSVHVVRFYHAKTKLPPWSSKPRPLPIDSRLPLAANPKTTACPAHIIYGRGGHRARPPAAPAMLGRAARRRPAAAVRRKCAQGSRSRRAAASIPSASIAGQRVLRWRRGPCG